MSLPFPHRGAVAIGLDGSRKVPMQRRWEWLFDSLYAVTDDMQQATDLCEPALSGSLADVLRDMRQYLYQMITKTLSREALLREVHKQHLAQHGS